MSRFETFVTSVGRIFLLFGAQFANENTTNFSESEKSERASKVRFRYDFSDVVRRKTTEKRLAELDGPEVARR